MKRISPKNIWCQERDGVRCAWLVEFLVALRFQVHEYGVLGQTLIIVTSNNHNRHKSCHGRNNKNQNKLNHSIEACYSLARGSLAFGI